MITSKQLLGLLVAMLLLFGLACSLLRDSPTPPSQLLSLSVEPFSGTGQFNVEVANIGRLGDTGFFITCGYPDPGGELRTMPVPIDRNKGE